MVPPVAWLVSEIWAFGTAAPVVSATLPLMVPASVWPKSGVAASSNAAAHGRSSDLVFMNEALRLKRLLPGSKRLSFRASFMKTRSLLLPCAAALLLAASPLFGQTEAGTISGRVADTTGAAVPNAQISLTNQATGGTIKVPADAAGSFVFTTVLPGTYT